MEQPFAFQEVEAYYSYRFLPIAFRRPVQKPKQSTKSWRAYSVCPHFCQPACCTPYSVPGSENESSVISFAGGVNRKVYCKRLLKFNCLQHNTKSKKHSLLNFVPARVELPGMSLLFNVKQNTIKIRTLLTVNRNLQKTPSNQLLQTVSTQPWQSPTKYYSWAFAIFVTVCRKLPEENCL